MVRLYEDESHLLFLYLPIPRLIMQFQLDEIKMIKRGHGGEFSLHSGERTPRKVMGELSNEVITGVACGLYHIIAITSTGLMYTLGDTSPFPIFFGIPRLVRDPKNVISVDAHSYHSACLTDTGEVYTWVGLQQNYHRYDNFFGMLGHGDSILSEVLQPKLVEALVDVKAISVACGMVHTAVSTEDGKVYTFGWGKEGQLGHGHEEDRSSPTLVLALEGKHITQIECGDFHTTALTSSGFVFTWGCGEIGYEGQMQQGKRFSVPHLVMELREHNVVQIATGH